MSVLLVLYLTTTISLPHVLAATEYSGVLTQVDSFLQEWSDFKQRFGKVYESSDAENARYEIFASNLRYIVTHNTDYQEGRSSFYLGINEYADMTHDEFRRSMRLNIGVDVQNRHDNVYNPPLSVLAPLHVDWRLNGSVTPVKNQHVLEVAGGPPLCPELVPFCTW